MSAFQYSIAPKRKPTAGLQQIPILLTLRHQQTLQHALPPCIHLRLHTPSLHTALYSLSSNPSIAMHPYALLLLFTHMLFSIPKHLRDLQKFPPYSGKLNSEMYGDSRHALLQDGQMLDQVIPISTWHCLQALGCQL